MDAIGGTVSGDTGGATSAGGTGGAGVFATGGGSNGGAVLNVRCFDYGSDILCFGTPGTDNWAVIWPECRIALHEIDPELEPAGNPAEASCAGISGARESLVGWDEVKCWRQVPSGFVQCYGKLGKYWIEIFPDCIWADVSSRTYAGDPAEIFCGTASDNRGGWDELRCINLAADPMSAVCYGRRGAYWVGATAVAHYSNGLFPTCELNPDGDLVEVPAEQARCPAGGG